MESERKSVGEGRKIKSFLGIFAFKLKKPEGGSGCLLNLVSEMWKFSKLVFERLELDSLKTSGRVPWMTWMKMGIVVCLMIEFNFGYFCFLVTEFVLHCTCYYLKTLEIDLKVLKHIIQVMKIVCRVFPARGEKATRTKRQKWHKLARNF